MVVDDAWRPANKSSANKSSKTSTRSCDCAFQAAEMRPLNAKLQSRDRILFFKSFQRPQIFENNFQLCAAHRSEEHTSELQSRQYLVCRLLLEKKKKKKQKTK